MPKRGADRAAILRHSIAAFAPQSFCPLSANDGQWEVALYPQDVADLLRRTRLWLMEDR